MRLKTNLLINILNGITGLNKYSNAFLNLKSVIELELRSGFDLPDDLLNEFKEIEKKFNNFRNDVPLKVIERYYYEHSNDLNKYVYINFNGKEIEEYKVINIYYDLENFFNEIFILAGKLADYYALDIKVKQKDYKDDIF